MKDWRSLSFSESDESLATLSLVENCANIDPKCDGRQRRTSAVVGDYSPASCEPGLNEPDRNAAGRSTTRGPRCRRMKQSLRSTL